MISIYLDWNVISQMKNGLHPELKTILESGRFFIPYSTSHIGDLLSGFNDTSKQREYVKSDLDFLSQLTNNDCLSNNGAHIELDHRVPAKLFETRLNERDIFQNFSLDGLQEIFNINEATKDLGKAWIDLIRAIRVDEMLGDALKEPENRKQFDVLFPGVAENPTMENFMMGIMQFYTRLNEGDDYKELRQIVQNGLGINRDRMFHADDPYSVITDKYKALNIEPYKMATQDGHGPTWFTEISNEYIQLDMHGYQEDKVRVNKGRRETFRNTTEDSYHAGFASTCDFYIINDTRSYQKTKKVYKQLKINTFVFKPEDFLNYYNAFLTERPLHQEHVLPAYYLNYESVKEEKLTDGTFKVYHLKHFAFDFFNKMIALCDDSGKTLKIALRRDMPTNRSVTYHFEIERLSSKLYEILGEDNEQLGHIKPDEFDQGKWIGRIWNFDTVKFKLFMGEGHLQLVYSFKQPEESPNGKKDIYACVKSLHARRKKAMIWFTVFILLFGTLVYLLLF